MAQTVTVIVKGKEGYKLLILNGKFKNDPRPIEEKCTCFTCKNYSRAYLRHLFRAKEVLEIFLTAIHNLTFMELLLRKIREPIKVGRLETLKQEWLRLQYH